MSQKSEAVKNWRRNTKERMVSSMGGCCQICGYNKTNKALEFHHLDPKEKEMGFGAVRGNIVSWNKIATELRKCILLCSNCHKEVHEGLTEIPKDFSKFDESFFDYKSLKPKKETIKKVKVTKVDWSKVDLLNLKKNFSNVQIGKQLGVSETAIRKRLKLIESHNHE